MYRKILNTVYLFGFLSVLVFSTHAEAMNDPCPLPENVGGEKPLNLADVQSDIDILKLCVERAALLERLNAFVEKETAADVFNTPPVSTGLVNEELFDLPVEDEEFEIADEEGAVEEEEEEEKVVLPKIINIFGNQVQGIKADIRAANGERLRVQAGETINDGIVVKEVSMKGVIITQEGDDMHLLWE